MSDSRSWLLAGMASCLVALCALCVYVCTAAPTITWAHDGVDSADFAAAVACGGVPHPTGYPTYLLIAALWSCLPWGDVAYRLNLLSAAAGAVSVGLTVLIAAFTLPSGGRRPCSASAERLPSHTPLNRDHSTLWGVTAAASAGLLLAFGPLLWSQAVIAEAYTLHLSFVLLLVLLGVYGFHRKSSWGVTLLFTLLGLGLGNHVSLVIVLPAILVLLWSEVADRPFKFFLSAVVGTGLGLCVYVVIPLRAVGIPPINWGGASHLQGFCWLVSGQAYRGLVLGTPPSLLPARLAYGLRIIMLSLGGWGFPFAVLGIVGLWERSRRFAVSTSLVFVLFGLYALLYDTTDSYVYLLPAAAMAAVWMTHGLRSVVELTLRPDRHGAGLRRLHLGAAGVVIGLSLIGLPWHWTDMNLGDQKEAVSYATETIRAVDSGSIIVVPSDRDTFPLWYVRYGLNLRKDVAIVNDALLHFEWYRSILAKHHAPIMADGCVTDVTELLASNVGKRPVYFTTRPEESTPGYSIVPHGRLWRVQAAAIGAEGI